MDKKVQIYPSTVIAAIEAAKQRNSKDINGYGAFRFNFKARKKLKLTEYIPASL